MTAQRLLRITAALTFAGVMALAAAYAQPKPTDKPEPTVICIAPFQDNTGDKKWQGLADGLCDLLTASFGEHKGVRVVDRQKLADVLKEHEITYRSLSEAKTAARVGKIIGADRIIAGGVLVIDGKPCITAHVLDVKSARIVASRKVVGEAEKILAMSFDLASQLAESLRVKLEPVAPDDYDHNPTASLHFMRGLGFHHAGDRGRAAMEFMVCGDLDPDHPTTRYWLGRCFLGLGEYEHALIEFRRFLADFPESPCAPDARKLSRECEAKITPPPKRLRKEQKDEPGK